MGKLHACLVVLWCAVASACAPSAKTWKADAELRGDVVWALADLCTATGDCGWVEQKSSDDADLTFSVQNIDGRWDEAAGDYHDGAVRIEPWLADDPELRQAVILHELGHAVGLGHDRSPYRSAMRPGRGAWEVPVVHLTCVDRLAYASVHGTETPTCSPEPWE